LIEVKKVVKIPVIASGGLRDGVEISKCLALGAEACGMAFPFLKRAAESLDSLYSFAELLIAELKGTMFLVGAQNLNELRNVRYTLVGRLKEELSV
jgi:isopentenyl-diphosphate delta-isomerase